MAMPSRTKPRPTGRTLAEFGALSVAEQRLLECCRLGEMAMIATDRPTEETDANRVRAAFLRFLALGGDDKAPVHEHGVQIQGAWLTGLFDLDSALVECRLSVWNSRIERVEATQCHIQFMNLSGCRIEDGFRADRIQSQGGLFLRNGFHVTGETRLLGATIGGDFDCSGGRFENSGGDALSFDRAKISGDVFLNDGFQATGAVRMPGVVIDGNLSCGNARFENPGRSALTFDGAEISGALFLSRGFQATGEVSLMDTVIGKSVECNDGLFDNGTDDAISADRSKISGGLFMMGAFAATGAVRLHGTSIGGNLYCNGAHFTCPGKIAMVWDAIKVTGDISLIDVVVTGEVRAIGATIGGDLQFNRAVLSNPHDDVLCFERARVAGGFFFREVTQIDGHINFSAMHVTSLCDDGKSWALANGRIVLDGFTYERLAGKAPADSRSRIDWLDQQRADHLAKEFRPQPWEQLISVLRAMGHPNEARRVAVAKQQRLRRARRITLGAWPFHFAYGALVDYGYYFPKLVAYIIGMWLACAGAYWLAVHPPGAVPASAVADAVLPNAVRPATYLIAPTSQEPSAACLIARAAAHDGDPCPPPAPDYGSFDPFIYSADVLLPIVNLGYKAEWKPEVSDANHKPLTAGHWLRYLYWAEIAFGWIAGALLVGVVGNLMKKD